jgi:hypothetical protein
MRRRNAVGEVIVVLAVAAEAVEPLPCRLQVRSYHHAKQNLVILQLKVRTVARGEWAVL